MIPSEEQLVIAGSDAQSSFVRLTPRLYHQFPYENEIISTNAIERTKAVFQAPKPCFITVSQQCCTFTSMPQLLGSLREAMELCLPSSSKFGSTLHTNSWLTHSFC